MSKPATNSFDPLRLFSSVISGIALMVLVALYIAIGSGFPRVRELFEMNELQFFDAWPLKVLMILLVTNLTVVTWRRIPLTPPRYGVWCVHAGIITLILGTAFYYHNKVEGSVRLYTNPAYGSVVADHFYDKDSRALYVKIDGTPWGRSLLPSLPRFSAYEASLGNGEELNRKDLRNIVPVVEVQDAGQSQPIRRTISQALGWKDELKLDVIGYYPYAGIATRFEQDPASKTTGLVITMPDMHEGRDFETWLVASDSRYRFNSFEGTDFEHRLADATMLAAFTESAKKIFQLDVKLGSFAQTLYVQPGNTYPLATTGYSVAIENYDPAWNMFGTHEVVKALTMKVTSPKQTFRRMLLDGRDLQTDFKLGEAGAPPMGKRQKAPLDHDLSLLLKVNDPDRLLPVEGVVKHTLITAPNEQGITDICVGNSTPMSVGKSDSGAQDVLLAAADAGANHPQVKLHFQSAHLRRDDSVQVVPPARRTRDGGESGTFQVLRVRVMLGAWSKDVLVPYAIDAGEVAWDDGVVEIPNTGSVLQLGLGQSQLPLPAKLTLNKFDLIPYDGGDKTSRSMMLDFRSTLTVEDRATGETSVDVAHMNNPVYFGGGSWLFFQAAYENSDQPRWTILGVGNRPGVPIMLLGCGMIVLGVLYAFYVKPIIIKRMKAKALAAAKATPRHASVHAGV